MQEVVGKVPAGEYGSITGRNMQFGVLTEESHETDLSSFRGNMHSVSDIGTQRTVFGATGRVFQGTLRSQTNNLKQEFPQDDEDDQNDEEQTPAFQESSSVYQIHKILSSDQYTIGKCVSEYIESFHMQYKNIKESSELLPAPMESVQDLINDLVRTFNMDFNLGKD